MSDLVKKSLNDLFKGNQEKKDNFYNKLERQIYSDINFLKTWLIEDNIVEYRKIIHRIKGSIGFWASDELMQIFSRVDEIKDINKDLIEDYMEKINFFEEKTKFRIEDLKQ